MSALASLGSAAVIWIEARRRAVRAGRATLWALLGVAFGLAGLLLVLALLEPVVRVKCEGCRRMRVVDRETCEHCGVAFEPPTKDGTEIVDPELQPAPAT